MELFQELRTLFEAFRALLQQAHHVSALNLRVNIIIIWIEVGHVISQAVVDPMEVIALIPRILQVLSKLRVLAVFLVLGET